MVSLGYSLVDEGYCWFDNVEERQDSCILLNSIFCGKKGKEIMKGMIKCQDYKWQA